MTNNKTRWLRLALGCITLFMAGIIYAWSVLRAPLEGFWDNSQLQLCFTLTLCFFCLGGLVSGLLGKKLSIRTRMLIAALLIVGGFGISGNLKGDNLFLLYLGYGIMAGLGIGIVYNVVIVATNAWFPDKKGFASGALMMFFGLSSLILGKVANAMFESKVGWSRTYIWGGVAVAAVVMIAAVLLKMPPKPEAKEEDGDTTPEPEEEDGYTTAQMIRRSSYWKLFVFLTLLGGMGSVAIGFGKNFFVNVAEFSPDTAVTFAGLLSICNGIGRLVYGFLFDKLGSKKTLTIVSVVALAAPALCLLAVIAKISIIGIIGIFLCAFSYGASPTVSAAYTAGFYGMKNYGLNLAVMNLTLVPASFASTVSAMLDTGTPYLYPFVFLTALSLIGLITSLTIKKA